MKFCPNCNLEYEDKYAFCHHCGSKLQDKVEQIFCPYCGNKVETDGVFCPFCGNSLEEDTTPKESNFTVSIDSSPVSSNEFVSPQYNAEFKDITQDQPIYEVKDSEEPFFSKRHFFSYDGRRGRMSYLSVQIFWSIITSVLTIFLTPVVLAMGNIGLLLALIIDSVLAYPMFCNTAKRMHDLNWPTSWAAILTVLGIFISYGNEATKIFARPNNTVLYGKLIVVLIFCIPFIYLTFKKGTDGPNQYGQDPL